MTNAPISPRPSGNTGGFWMNYGLVIVGLLLVVLIAGLLVAGWLVLSGRLEGPPEAAPPTVKKQDVGGQTGGAKVMPPQRDVGKPPKHALDAGAKDQGDNAATAATPADGGVKIITPENSAALMREADETVRKFFAARTAEEKLPFVRHQERVKPMMVDYYDVHHHADPKTGYLKGRQFFQRDGRQFAHLVFSAEGLIPVAEIALEVTPAGAMQIDWESLVGAGEMDWADLKRERPAKPVLLRALAASGSYYNFEFEETTKWRCISLTWLDGGTIYAFVERDGDTARRLASFLKDGLNHPATVRVSFPEHAASDNCVRLVEWVSDSWFKP